jgi:hypothetical protein
MEPSNKVWIATACLLAACAPALDWREVRPDDSGVTLLFPCKPDSHARKVNLGPHQVRLVLYACTASGSTWALAFADMTDPALVGAALSDLRDAAAQNLSASAIRPLPLKVDGATPSPLSQRVEIQGRMPDGRPVTEQLAVFAKGTKVFQATVLGEKLEPEAADEFFRALRFAP